MKNALVSLGVGIVVFLLCYFVLPSPVTYVTYPEPCQGEICPAVIPQPTENTNWVWFARFGDTYDQRTRHNGLDSKSSEIEKFVFNPLVYSLFFGLVFGGGTFLGMKIWRKK